MSENPVLTALEAYRRTHPHRSDEIDEAFERFDPDSAAAADANDRTDDTVVAEQLVLEDDGAA